MCCTISNGSIATSQKLTMKHENEIFESHLLQQPKNLIATFEIIYHNIKKIIATQRNNKKDVQK